MNLVEMLDGNEYGLFRGPDLLRGASPKEYLIEHLLYEKDVICISSKAGVGKSVLAKQLMCCLTTGQPFLETFRVAHACNVLYIQTEGDRSETIERLMSMSQGVPIDHSRWIHLNLPGASFNDENEMDQLIALIKGQQMLIGVIIIDPLYTTIKGNLNDNQVVTDWIRNVRKLKGIFDCSVIVLNHENKEIFYEGQEISRTTGSIFGSTFWAAFFNHNYKLRVFDGHHLLEIGKNRSGKAVDRVAMKMVDEPLMYVPYDPELSENGIKILSLLRVSDVISAKKIIEVTQVKRATAFRILKKFVDETKISRVYCPKRGELYTMLSEEEALKCISKAATK